MKTKPLKGRRPFQLKILGYGNSYYIERVAKLEKALSKNPRQLQIDMIGSGEIPADMALLIRSILVQRSAKTQIITNARSSLQGGSVLVWLSGDTRILRSDARIFFRRAELSEDEEPDDNKVWKECDLKYSDSYSETDPEEADYAKVLQVINEFLPVKELAGRALELKQLRQFGLVENEKLDHFLAAAFGQSPTAAEGSTGEPKAKQARAKGKNAQANK